MEQSKLTVEALVHDLAFLADREKEWILDVVHAFEEGLVDFCCSVFVGRSFLTKIAILLNNLATPLLFLLLFKINSFSPHVEKKLKVLFQSKIITAEWCWGFNVLKIETARAAAYPNAF